MKRTKRSQAPGVLTLFVCNSSADAVGTEAALRAKGLNITRADNVCFAELYAERQRFEAAIYDLSVSPEEQVSLAQIMRIRWPWMRIIRWASPGAPVPDESLFDCTALSESQLAACVQRQLGR